MTGDTGLSEFRGGNAGEEQASCVEALLSLEVVGKWLRDIVWDEVSQCVSELVMRQCRLDKSWDGT